MDTCITYMCVYMCLHCGFCDGKAWQSKYADYPLVTVCSRYGKQFEGVV